MEDQYITFLSTCILTSINTYRDTKECLTKEKSLLVSSLLQLSDM